MDVRVDGGAWQSVVANATATSASYTTQQGHSYTFRVTATDNAGNTASAQTTLTPQGKRVTKYYALGSQRVAMCAGGVLYYLHGDHLGSASPVTSITGAVVARQLYGPYGTPRWSSGTLPTDYRYTGQREETGLGSLYDYGARFYSPYLNRWLQPDSIVPQPGNPQSLNRYSYTLNNPLKYTDPTGHIPASVPPRPVGLWSILNVNVSDWSPLARGLLQYGACTFVPCTIGSDGQVHDDMLAQANAAIPGPATITSGSSQFIRAGTEVADEVVAKQAGQYLAQLTKEGDRVVVPTGKISAKIMGMLSKVSNAEFALFRSKDGLRYLVRGTEAGIDLPDDVAKLIAHSETSTKLIPSGFDEKYLRFIKQTWSILINEEGTTARFNKAPEYPQPSSLAEALEWAKVWFAEHDK